MAEEKIMDFGEVLDLIREQLKKMDGIELAGFYMEEFAMPNQRLKYEGDSLFELTETKSPALSEDEKSNKVQKGVISFLSEKEKKKED